MGLLGIDFGSCTSERSADYILSLPGSAPEYMNEVSFGCDSSVPSILSHCCTSERIVLSPYTYSSGRKSIQTTLKAAWDLRQISTGFAQPIDRSTCRYRWAAGLIDSPSIRRRGMSKNFPKQVFCIANFLDLQLLILLAFCYYFIYKFAAAAMFSANDSCLADDSSHC